MGETIRILAIDDNPDRIRQLVRYISEHCPDLKIEYPSDIKTLIQHIETTTYDCIISPEEISVLDNLELIQKLSEIMSLPIIRYLGESRLPISTKGHSESFKDNLLSEDAVSYDLLVKRIRRTINPVVKRGTPTTLKLPMTPRIIVRSNKLFIVGEDGSEELWGNEDEETIEEIAYNMELELKAIQWVRLELERFIGELTEVMKCSDIPRNDISDIIYEGYRSLLIRFQKMDESYNER